MLYEKIKCVCQSNVSVVNHTEMCNSHTSAGVGGNSERKKNLYRDFARKFINICISMHVSARMHMRAYVVCALIKHRCAFAIVHALHIHTHARTHTHTHTHEQKTSVHIQAVCTIPSCMLV